MSCVLITNILAYLRTTPGAAAQMRLQTWSLAAPQRGSMKLCTAQKAQQGRNSLRDVTPSADGVIVSLCSSSDQPYFQTRSATGILGLTGSTNLGRLCTNPVVGPYNSVSMERRVSQKTHGFVSTV